MVMVVVVVRCYAGCMVYFDGVFVYFFMQQRKQLIGVMLWGALWLGV